MAESTEELASDSQACGSVRLLRTRAANRARAPWLFGTSLDVLVQRSPLLARCENGNGTSSIQAIRSILASVAAARGVSSDLQLYVEPGREPPCIPAAEPAAGVLCSSCQSWSVLSPESEREPCAPGAADGGEKVRLAAALGDAAADTSESSLVSRPSILSSSLADST